jgi:hypothetical protein
MLMEFSGPAKKTPALVAPVLSPVWIFSALILAALGLMLAFGASIARAETSETAGNSFLREEYQVFGGGASGSWRNIQATTLRGFDQIGGDGMGDEIGGGSSPDEDPDEEKGPSNTGDKVKAGLLSALVPGTGQFYNHQNSKGYVMLGIEAGIWITYFVFDSQGDARMESSQEWSGIYAGTSGAHENSYWQNVGHYMDSDAYNESRLREARALQEPVSGLIGGSDAWQWVNEERKNGYSQLRADGNSAYDKRDFMILFAVVNRVVSVVDAVLNAGKDESVLETEVLGMNLGFEVLPSWKDPGARWVVSRSF